MAGHVRNLLNRDGRYFAWLAALKELWPYIGKTELRSGLGPDYRTAMKMLPGAVATLQHDIALGERRAVAAGEQSITGGPIHFFHHKQPLETIKCARPTVQRSGRTTINMSDIVHFDGHHNLYKAPCKLLILLVELGVQSTRRRLISIEWPSSCEDSGRVQTNESAAIHVMPSAQVPRLSSSPPDRDERRQLAPDHTAWARRS